MASGLAASAAPEACLKGTVSGPSADVQVRHSRIRPMFLTFWKPLQMILMLAEVREPLICRIPGTQKVTGKAEFLVFCPKDAGIWAPE